MPEEVMLAHPNEEPLDLMEMHRQFMESDGFALAHEHDTYSLAQPSPFRFVPSIASNGAAALLQGE